MLTFDLEDGSDVPVADSPDAVVDCATSCVEVGAKGGALVGIALLVEAESEVVVLTPTTVIVDGVPVKGVIIGHEIIMDICAANLERLPRRCSLCRA
jgi:hypothetical protein